MGSAHRQGCRRHAARARMDGAAARRVQFRAAEARACRNGRRSGRERAGGRRSAAEFRCRRSQRQHRVDDRRAPAASHRRLRSRAAGGLVARRHRLGRLARCARISADRQSAVAAAVDREPAHYGRSMARQARRRRLRHRRARATDPRRSARARSLHRARHARDPARRSGAVSRALEGSARDRAASRTEIAAARRARQSARRLERTRVDRFGGLPRRARVARRSHRYCARRFRRRGAREVSPISRCRSCRRRSTSCGRCCASVRRICWRRATPIGMRC